MNHKQDQFVIAGALEVLSDLLKDNFCYEILSNQWMTFTTLFV